MNIVEKELLRKGLWYGIIDKIHGMKLETFDNTILPMKDIQNLLLRFLFNKNLDRKVGDDPVFIVSESEGSKNGLRDDLLYFNVINYRYEEIYDILQKEFVRCSRVAKDVKVANDNLIVYDKSRLEFYYKGKMYRDYNGTGIKYEKKRNIVLAMLIRYSYINLSTYGLANNYEAMGFGHDDCIEAFANPFNRYFDHYYSAFPEERLLDSKGSFLDVHIETLDNKIIMINPPFDLNVIKRTLILVNKILDHHKGKNSVTIHLTLPAWLDIEEFILLENHKHTTKFEVMPKEDTIFIDYSRNGVNISPCNIISVIMKV